MRVVRIAVAVVQADDLEEIMAEIESGEGKVHRAAERASMECMCEHTPDSFRELTVRMSVVQKTSHGAQTEGIKICLNMVSPLTPPILGHQKLLDILQNFKVPIERMDSRISDLHTNLAGRPPFHPIFIPTNPRRTKPFRNTGLALHHRIHRSP